MIDLKKYLLFSFLSNKLRITIGVHALLGFVVANTFIFSNALFLSFYPTQWIPYLYFSQTLAEVIVSLLVGKYLVLNPIKHAIRLQLLSALIGIAAICLLPFGYYYTRFVVVLLLNSVAVTMAMIAWNASRNAFDFIEFKYISKVLPITSTMIKVLTGLANTWLVQFLPLQFMLYFIVIGLVASCFLIRLLVPLPFIKKYDKPVGAITTYPLFFNMFFFSMIIAAMYTIGDYMFSMKLAESFGEKGIVEYYANFIAIAFTLSSILSFFFIANIIKNGIIFLLIILPLYWLIVSPILMFDQSLIAITLMAGGNQLFVNNFFGLGREIILSSLPNEFRRHWQAAIEILPESIGAVCISLLLIVLNQYSSVFNLSIVVFTLSFILILFCIKIKKDFISTLSKEIMLKRFTDGDISPIQDTQTKKFVMQMLQSGNIKSIIFAYSLIGKDDIEAVSSTIIQHLDHENKLIRMEAIIWISTNQYQAALPKLINLLHEERDEEVLYYIISALSLFHYPGLKRHRHTWLKSTSFWLQAAAINSLLSSSAVQDKKTALTHFMDLSSHIHLIDEALVKTAPKPLLVPILKRLIANNNAFVSAYAIDLAFAIDSRDFLPYVVERIAGGGVLSHVEKYLIRHAEGSLLLLVGALDSTIKSHPLMAPSLIASLAVINLEEVEIHLHDYANKGNTLLRQYVALETLQRARKMPLSSTFKSVLLDFAFEEYYLIVTLRSMASHQSRSLGLEMQARASLATIRFLCWIASYYAPEAIFGLMPTILDVNSQEKRAKAIELLNTHIKNKSLIHATLRIFTSIMQVTDTMVHKKTKPLPLGGVPLNPKEIMQWLEEVMIFPGLSEHEIMRMAEKMTMLTLSKDMVIFKKGDEALCLYIILDGTVNIVKDNNQIIATLGKGRSFGEVSLLRHSIRKMHAISQSEGTLFCISRRDFEEIVKEFPDVYQKLSAAIHVYYDKWLFQCTNVIQGYAEERVMNLIQNVFILRQVVLFNKLPGETLSLIAQELETIPMYKDQIIFKENDLPSGLYIIDTGQVNIIRGNMLLATLDEFDFFGELAIIDDAPRTATAVAASDGNLLFLTKDTFDRITNDLPDVLRQVVKVIISYIRGC